MQTMTQAPIEATCKYAARNTSTRNGDRSNAVFTLPDGSDVTIWKNPDDPDLFAIRKGDRVPLVASGKTYKLWVSEQAKQQPEQPTAATKEEIGTYIQKSAKLYRYCLDTVTAQLADTDMGTEQMGAIALQLHAQTCQKFNL